MRMGMDDQRLVHVEQRDAAEFSLIDPHRGGQGVSRTSSIF
jgi:hypothetical protein